MIRDIIKSITRGFGYSLGKLLFFILLGLFAFFLTSKAHALTIGDVSSGNVTLIQTDNYDPDFVDNFINENITSFPNNLEDITYITYYDNYNNVMYILFQDYKWIYYNSVGGTYDSERTFFINYGRANNNQSNSNLIVPVNAIATCRSTDYSCEIVLPFSYNDQLQKVFSVYYRDNYNPTNLDIHYSNVSNINLLDNYFYSNDWINSNNDLISVSNYSYRYQFIYNSKNLIYRGNSYTGDIRTGVTFYNGNVTNNESLVNNCGEYAWCFGAIHDSPEEPPEEDNQIDYTNILEEISSKIGTGFQNLGETISNGFNSVISTITNAFNTLKNALFDVTGLNTLVNAFNTLKNGITDLYNTLNDYFDIIIGFINDFITSIREDTCLPLIIEIDSFNINKTLTIPCIGTKIRNISVVATSIFDALCYISLGLNVILYSYNFFTKFSIYQMDSINVEAGL